MNHNAWRRSLIAVAVTVALVPAAWSASLSLDPTLLPGGQADFVPLGRELQRLALAARRRACWQPRAAKALICPAGCVWTNRA
ncbi:hypothetical protein [Halomonas sp. E19]|uniref:hypothetical protein n=1 Tax=Halomonas sp. E19 TaxID=3397247 RepID=UPI004033AA67